ncbi:hypothetical protein ACFXPS_25725 [Nocardia sp. NPDC059091]|uniref:hypothetical protein n=1 Tax=unclassified Nocardia TaxID=2637762 RepID=UPI00369342BC
MNTQNRAVRTGLAALALATAFATAAGPAAADISLRPPASSSPADIVDTSTGSGSSLIQTGSAAAQSGSAAIIDPLYKMLCAIATLSSICNIGDL